MKKKRCDLKDKIKDIWDWYIRGYYHCDNCPYSWEERGIHCENILVGKKKSELRLRAPYQPTPYRAFLYDCSSSGGSGMVVGECDVYDDVRWRMCVGIPSHLSESACITNDEIWRYCQKGQKDIHELRLRNVKRYDTPKKLSDFSSEASRLTFSDDGNKLVLSGMTRPPQSWCYVEEMEKEQCS